MPASAPFHTTTAKIASVFAAALMAGGLSYSFVRLPADSVGSRELKNNAVTSREVADRSLKARDFAAGQLRAGPQGPAGPTGPPGAKGDTGGPCDGLLCAGTDLTTGVVEVSANGQVVGYVSAYRIGCDATACTVAVGGSPSNNRAFDDWFQLAVTDPTSAVRDFDLTILDANNSPIRRYAVSGGLPIELAQQSGRFQLKMTSTGVTREAP